MTVEPYRKVLALPGVRVLLFVGLLARIPITAAGLTLTLHVVHELQLGFFRAGIVGAASTLGVALGSPVAGRFVDRYGLRPVLVVTTVAQVGFWFTAPHLSYWPLVAGALVGGALSLPVFGVVRQCIAAMVPADQRRPAFALDSMLVEVSYMVGPAAAVAGVTGAGGLWTMGAIAVGLLAAGAGLLMLNPPTRAEDEEETGGRPVPRRVWLTPATFGLFGVVFATTFILSATELGIVAALKADGAETWTGLFIAVWCLWSLVGGFVYGALPRAVSPLVMVALMGALTAPVGLVGGWPWLAVALVPAGLLCSPALSSTIDTLSRWVPSSARGEAMGLHGTALTLGVAASGPTAGSVIDAHGAGWGFALAGTLGVVMVLLALPAWRTARVLEPEGEREPVAA
ncbi:MFS transporter [Actinocorallia longicatena]|uniref:MFS transporter n=1 Tax=Actinocorallia longicatena TaxID=111803 RepID=A0ABP6PXJ1_9ACTN